MKITNKYGLPEAFVKAVDINYHNPDGHYSATTLNRGIKEVILTKRHFDEIEVDVADNIWAIWGSAVHALLESMSDNNFHEEYLKYKVSNSYVTGRLDSYDLVHGVLYDWKTASTWKVKMDDFSDWYKQGMTYAWLLDKHKLDIFRVVFVALLKDHSKSTARRDTNYPQSPVYVYQFDIDPEELAFHDAWIKDKVIALELAELYPDDEIPECTMEERWADPDKYAVMKRDRKSAVKLFDSKDDAEEMVRQLGKDHYIEYRPSVSRKCEEYCDVKKWCSFYKQTHQEEEV